MEKWYGKESFSAGKGDVCQTALSGESSRKRERRDNKETIERRLRGLREMRDKEKGGSLCLCLLEGMSQQHNGIVRLVG
jgi:hypothetical protein